MSSSITPKQLLGFASETQSGLVSTSEQIFGGNKTFISGIKTIGQSQANSVSNATAVTVASATPTAIASTTIITTGKPVLLVASGDANPNQAGGWHRARIYRGEIAIGKQVINENPGGSSVNCPFSLCFIDTPPAGTHTYTIRVWQGSGSFTFGEEGDVQASTILSMEIL